MVCGASVTRAPRRSRSLVIQTGPASVCCSNSRTCQKVSTGCAGGPLRVGWQTFSDVADSEFGGHVTSWLKPTAFWEVIIDHSRETSGSDQQARILLYLVLAYPVSCRVNVRGWGRQNWIKKVKQQFLFNPHHQTLFSMPHCQGCLEQ